ncbi:ATP binding subunit of chaperone protease [Hamiltosporidium tvaerminnensis]|uniref:ATP binding subunit of chaperone protease n=1 Tax=Hamiltosporidium tvaerminnensis TaxID=1176355 RepID=A0A4Q9LUX8_9MICR|nr:ATP binding subunit of chaperone protease [Hamiltosporidium tvaerminnensis]
MQKNYDQETKKLLDSAFTLAYENNNSTVEPEHLLRVILEEKQTTLKPEDKRIISEILLTKIHAFPKQQDAPVPNIGTSLLKVIMESEKIATTRNESVTPTHLLSSLLEIPKIKTIFTSKNIELPSLVKSDALSQFSVDMIEQARQNLLDPVIGRDEEIRLVMEILAKKTKSNPILVGNPGVGKTAIVSGLAQLIAKNKVPTLANAKIYNIDVGAMVAGTSLRGAFEERLKKVIKEAEKSPNIILFIDEIHIVLSAGSTGESAMDAANMLKPSLASGAIKCIGATTFEEYRKYIEKDPAFARRFVQVTVKEPNIEDTVTMLRGMRERMELHHGIKISDDALVFAAKCAKKYIPRRHLPDSAIDLIDTACASMVIDLEGEPQELLNIKGKIWSAELEKAALELDLGRIKNQQDNIIEERLKETETKIQRLNNELKPLEENFYKGKGRILEIKKIKKRIDDLNSKLSNAERDRDIYTVVDIQQNILPILKEKLEKLEKESIIGEIIGPNNVAEVLSRWVGINVGRITLKENERLLNMGDRIKSRIFGQDTAVDTVVRCLLQNRVGLSVPNKPIGTFLFLGPTGVGKTELAKALSYELFDDEKNMVCIDMSEYGNEMSVSKLVGVSAGYVGYGEGGVLTEAVRNKPYNVVLLDEVDLAHSRALNLLYQILDEGRVMDGKGVVVDFTNTVIIMTSNIGQNEILSSKNVEEVKGIVENKIVEKFGMALFNRMDGVVYFNVLTIEVMSKIFDYNLNQMNKRLKEKKLMLKVSDRVKDDVLARCFNQFYGARPLKRYMQKNFMDGVTRLILSHGSEIEKGIISCYCDDEGIIGEIVGDYVYVLNAL